MKTAVLQVLTISLILGTSLAPICYGTEVQSSEVSILELSLEDLLNIEVTSVSKRPQSLQDAAAAIFVVTNDDLRRMGVTNIPDALRLVPGLHVGRIDSNKWAVTSRGLNGRFNNKLLVLVDGRNVYTTSFAGVYWEVQDPLLEDIDRIEIIRGPGSTLWGANAVSGVINIITKHAADTQGGLAVAGGGDLEKGFASLRWGTKLSEGTYAKVYGKATSRGQFTLADGEDANDDWNMFRGGFQLNSQRDESESLTLQGDIYNGLINQKVDIPRIEDPYSLVIDDEAKVSGGHLLGRTVHTLSSQSEISFQVYFDRAVREEAMANQATSTFDLDFQHQLAASKHLLVWGLGYRHVDNEVVESVAYFRTQGRGNLKNNVFSAFIQDEINLLEDRLALTVGSKFEHNGSTGFEIQPSLRLLWHASNEHRMWGAVSRAVRTPMPGERAFEVLLFSYPPNIPENPAPLPVGFLVTGNDAFVSEELVAYEWGYRFAKSSVTADVTAFYNDFTGLQEVDFGEPEVRYWEDPMFVAIPADFVNTGSLNQYGAELAFAWQTKSWLRWDLAYSYLKDDLGDKATLTQSHSLSPEHIMSVNFSLKPANEWNLSAGLRYVDECMSRGPQELEERTIPAYTTMDARIGWYFRTNMELSLVGRNLLQENHLEYISEYYTLTTEVPRSFYMKLQWEF